MTAAITALASSNGAPSSSGISAQGTITVSGKIADSVSRYCFQRLDAGVGARVVHDDAGHRLVGGRLGWDGCAHARALMTSSGAAAGVPYGAPVVPVTGHPLSVK